MTLGGRPAPLSPAVACEASHSWLSRAIGGRKSGAPKTRIWIRARQPPMPNVRFFLTWDEASYFPLWMCAGMAGRFEWRVVRLGRPLTNMVGSSVVDQVAPIWTSDQHRSKRKAERPLPGAPSGVLKSVSFPPPHPLFPLFSRRDHAKVTSPTAGLTPAEIHQHTAVGSLSPTAAERDLRENNP